MLQSELTAIGSPYVIVKKQQEADIEGPTTLGIAIREMLSQAAPHHQ